MSTFINPIASVMSLLLVMAVGYWLGGRGWFNKEFRAALAKLIMNVALPNAIFASTFHYLKIDTFISCSSALLYCVVGITIGYVIAWAVVRITGMRPDRRGVASAAIMGTNAAFVGLPLSMAVLGPESIPYVLIFLIINNIYIFSLGTYFLISANPDPDDPGRKGTSFSLTKFIPMPLWGFIVAIPFVVCQIPLPGFLSTAVNSIGSIATPLSLIYIGLILRDFGLLNIRVDKDILIVVLGRFVMAPVVMAVVIAVGLVAGIKAPLLEKQTLIIQSATPTFAVIPIMAQQYRGDATFATSIVALTSTLFIVVAPVTMMLS